MKAGGASHDLSLADFEGVGVYHRVGDDTDATLAEFGGSQPPARTLVTSLPMVGTASSVEAPVADWSPVPFTEGAPAFAGLQVQNAMGELRGFGAYEDGAPPWIAPTIAGAGVALLLGAAWYKGWL